MQLLRASYLIDTIWLLALMLYIVAGIALVPFHGDEPTQIYMGRDFYYLAEGDLDKIRFQIPPVSPPEQDLRMLNGTIAKTLFGFAAYTTGYEIHEINDQWDWGGDWQYNVDTGHMPSDDLLLRTRFVSTIFLAVGTVVIFWIGKEVGNRKTAYFVSFYYAFHPVLLVQGRRAMMEGVFVFFIMLTVLAALIYLKKRNIWSILFLGISSGFALASKHTAAFTLLTVFAGIALYYIIIEFQNRPRFANARNLFYQLLVLGVTGLLGLVTFYALTPAWWTGNPIDHVTGVWGARQGLLAGQVAVFGGYADFFDQVRGLLEHSLLALPQYFEVDQWATYPVIIDQIVAYESSIWRGISIGGSVVGGVVFVILIGVGIINLYLRKEIQSSTRWLLGFWFVMTGIIALIVTPIEWQRYYVMVYPAIGVIGAFGLSSLVEFFQTQQTQMMEHIPA